jgi:hypothetical protein
MEFGQALVQLRAGEKITRQGWHGKGMWLELQRPGPLSKMTEPYIYMVLPLASTALQHDRLGRGTVSSARLVPWLASQTDILAFDWYVA